MQIIARPVKPQILAGPFHFAVFGVAKTMSHRLSCFILRAAALSVLLLSLQTSHAAGQAPPAAITYRLTMSRPVSHLFEVKIEASLPENETAESLDFQMPRWSPGRYAIFDFAKN